MKKNRFFLLSNSILQVGKLHIIAESLTKPYMTEIVPCMIGEKAAKKIATIQYSTFISDRIHNILDYIEDQLINKLKSCNIFNLLFNLMKIQMFLNFQYCLFASSIFLKHISKKI